MRKHLLIAAGCVVVVAVGVGGSVVGPVGGALSVWLFPTFQFPDWGYGVGVAMLLAAALVYP
jgi:hypothetical protein